MHVLPRHAKTKTAAGVPVPVPESKNSFLSAAMPTSARDETMSLSLGNASLTVPVAGAGAFATLSDLLLIHARNEPNGTDNERNLGILLLASYCPRLRRLHLEHITGLSMLHCASPQRSRSSSQIHVHSLKKR